MRQRQFNGPTLPKELRDQVGGDPGNRKRSGHARGGPLNRKDRRKTEREAKKTQKQQKPSHAGRHNTQTGGARRKVEPVDEEEDDIVDWSDEGEPAPPPARTVPALPKGILKKAQVAPARDAKLSPLPSSKVSRAAKDRLAQDDAEIAKLEKKLGMKRKKKGEAEGDGLDDIFSDLGGLGSDDDDMGVKPSKRKRDQDDEWLAKKRRKALGESADVEDVEGSDIGDEHSIESGSEEELDIDDIDEDDLGEDDGSEVDLEDQGSDFEGFESEDPVKEETPRVRENPYVAPVAAGTTPAKYIPPALRALPSSDAEALARLRRQIQGLFNRLSDANILSILKDIEKVYQNNPRGYVTTTLVDLLIGMLADPTTLIDTFLILHAGFIAAIYKVIGPDFGAQMLERIVQEFDKHYQPNKDGNGKQTSNLISVLADIYCFQVIGCKLIFDYIKYFLDELSEINTELLLRIVKVAGSQLRQDDPSSLKDIVILLQKSVAKVGEKNLPVRTKFMIETITDLKNNRMKTGVAASAIVHEHITSMKKQIGTLNTRNLKGSEPLRIGLADIRDTDKKGKWWVVGASWRSNVAGEAQEQKIKDKNDDVNELVNSEDVEDDGEVDLLQLAKEQRMNTDIRRAIFITIMSSSDYKDAHVRLLKLRLKKAEEVEIPRVILHCAGCEDSYNPYYTALARKFCTDHKSRKTFQFALWDVFRKLGEKKDEDDASDDEDNPEGDMSLRRIVTLGKLYGTLIANGDLSITCLKTLNFPYMKPKTKTLIEVLLVTVMLESQKGHKEKRNEKALLNVFINVDSATEMITGLQYFMKKVVSRTDITANSKEKETVRWACKVVMSMLERLMATTTLEEE
ncbi:hypothetical protein BU23DRAFT_549120 [Bimuria novae-zelandiae CBS 107.79]|uniref:MI domain-containing protein n=1 Tax=Bimuria novae-zelandiae CBS 107.79 TaxID=1447943 RepID=A0A6A5VQI2_9PLEO|nr:hypothetical protein BU23DRAFT_549120 [Bimuria novae-zelandiae CBS 107.79]